MKQFDRAGALQRCLSTQAAKYTIKMGSWVTRLSMNNQIRLNEKKSNTCNLMFID